MNTLLYAVCVFVGDCDVPSLGALKYVSGFLPLVLDMGPFNCLSCKAGYELEDSVCYSRCDLGTYFVNHVSVSSV